MEEMNWIAECATFVIMLGLSVVIGLYYGCVQGKQNTIDEYLLGGKHMSVFPITMSLIASHISGISLLGVPTEVYSHGTQFLIVGVIDVVNIIITIYIFLPVFYELQLTSIYEYLELRFNSTIRGFSSLIFCISIILYIPVVIYIPALAFNQVTGFNVHYATLIICSICIFYTTFGGLKAVVWTDAIQSVFTAASIAIVIIMGTMEVGGFGNMIKVNEEGGRLEFFRMETDPFLRHTFWTVSIGTTIQWLSSLGIHPGTVQRCVALPSMKKARNALIYFVLGVGVVQMLTGLTGMLIYAKYKDCDRYSANYIENNKNLVPYYVMDVVSKVPGVTGLFISGIISAALSTMSAQLNTVSGTIYEDFIVKMMGVQVSDLTASIIMKCTVVITGFLCVALVEVVEKLNGILQVAISLSSITSGALLSVFTLGVCFPWANSRGSLCGIIASIGVMTWIVYGAQTAIHNNELKFVEKSISVTGCPTNVTFKSPPDFSGLYRLNEDVYLSPNVWSIYSISYMYYATIGTFVGIAVGLVVSWLFPLDQNVDPKLLAPCIRKFISTNYETEVEEYQAVAVFQDTKL